MAHDPLFLVRRGAIGAVCIGILLLASSGTPATAQSRGMPPITIPIPRPDFHFSDPARDAQYWTLEVEAERTLAAFHESVIAARHAIFPDAARPSTPVQPGTPAWLEARAAVQRAIRARWVTYDVQGRAIAFATRARREVPPGEAESALDIRRRHEVVVQATAETLVDLLAALAGVRADHPPL